MQPASPQSLLSEEQRYLRAFIAGGKRSCRQEWINGAFPIAFIIILLAISQWLLRWLPAQLKARELAICWRGQTLHHGALWVPSSIEFTDLLNAPIGLSTIYALFLGMAMFICYIQNRECGRLARLLARLLPDQTDRP